MNRSGTIRLLTRDTMATLRNETSQIILDAAFTCIAKRGSARVTLRDIAEEAGVALSQLNYYFKNKEGLFSEVLSGMRQRYLQEIEKSLENLPTAQDKILHLIKFNKTLLITNKDLYRAFLEFFNIAMWSISFNREMNKFLDDIAESITLQLEKDAQAIKNSHIKSPIVFVKLILATTFGVAMQYLMDPENAEVLAGFDALEALI